MHLVDHAPVSYMQWIRHMHEKFNAELMATLYCHFWHRSASTASLSMHTSPKCLVEVNPLYYFLLFIGISSSLSLFSG